MATLPVPETKVETYLDKIAGENPTLPVPETKIEAYLNAIAQNSQRKSVPAFDENDAGKSLLVNNDGSAAVWGNPACQYIDATSDSSLLPTSNNEVGLIVVFANAADVVTQYNGYLYMLI